MICRRLHETRLGVEVGEGRQRGGGREEVADLPRGTDGATLKEHA